MAGRCLLQTHPFAKSEYFTKFQKFSEYHQEKEKIVNWRSSSLE